MSLFFQILPDHVLDLPGIGFITECADTDFDRGHVLRKGTELNLKATVVLRFSLHPSILIHIVDRFFNGVHFQLA